MIEDMHKLIAEKAFGRYLEIGVNEGDSLLAALSNGRVTSAVGIDPWDATYGGSPKGNPKYVLGRIPEQRRASVLLLQGESSKVLPVLYWNQFDTILIDGDHSRDGALLDLNAAIKMLSINGSIFFDDLDNASHPYLRALVSEFIKREDLVGIVRDVHCGVAEIRFHP